MGTLETYFACLDKLFRPDGLLEELAILRRHYENLAKGKVVFRPTLLGMSSRKFFEKNYLFGRKMSECNEERIQEELNRLAENAGIGSFEGLLYERVMYNLARADMCAHELQLETLKKPNARKYWSLTKGKVYPIKEVREFIDRYTFCKAETNYLGKHGECYIDSYNRSAMRRRLGVMHEYGLKISIREMETLDRRELEKAKRRAQRKIAKEA